MRMRNTVVLSVISILAAVLPASAEEPAKAPRQQQYPPAHRPSKVRFEKHGNWSSPVFERNVTLGEGIDIRMDSAGGTAHVRMDLRRTEDVDFVALINQLHKYYAAKKFDKLTRSWVAMDGSQASFRADLRYEGKRQRLVVMVRRVPKQPEYTVVVTALWPRATHADRLRTLNRTIASLEFE